MCVEKLIQYNSIIRKTRSDITSGNRNRGILYFILIRVWKIRKTTTTQN